MQALIAKSKVLIAEQWLKLSNQEKILIITALAIGALFLIAPIYDGINNIFAVQNKKLSNTQTNVKLAPQKISEYLALLKRRNEVIERYKKVDLKQGVRSHIESLIKTHISTDTNPTIQNLNIKKIGEGYVQEPFKVGFNTKDIKTLSKFLKELVEGKQPLVLSRLVIKRGRRSDELEVTLDTSSIRSESPNQH
ncbi:MAG: hypothetical protein R3A13_10640 [Bdellovibrionota bacterium]